MMIKKRGDDMLLLIAIIAFFIWIFEASPSGNYNSFIDGEFDEARFGGVGHSHFD